MCLCHLSIHVLLKHEISTPDVFLTVLMHLLHVTV